GMPLRDRALAVPDELMKLWEGGSMNLPRRHFVHLAGGAAALPLVMPPANRGAWSQATRPIRIVVPFPPGGGSDILARLLADQIGRTQGQTLLLENRARARSAARPAAASPAAPGRV